MEMNKKILNGLELVRDVAGPALDMLANAAELRSYARGGIIFHKEDKAIWSYILISGRVKIFRGIGDGKEQTLFLVEAGEPFCLCALRGAASQPASASALVPSQVLAIPGQTLLKAGDICPVLLRNIIAILNNRLLTSMQMVEDLALRDIAQRLASLLLHAMNLQCGCGREEVRLPAPKHEIAKILGTTPESLSRVLTRLSAEGLIATDKRVIRILDRDALAGLAASD